MSINHSPSIVTNGLLFYYDMNNKLKSFIGKPITNLYYATNNYLNGNGNHWVNSGAATFNDNDTSLAPPTVIQGSGAPTGLPSNLRTTSATVTTVGNQECGMNITTVSASTQYTMSVWFYQTSSTCCQGPNGAVPYMRTNVNNNSIATFAYNGSTDSSTWPIKKWIRITATGTTQSNENGIYLSSYIGNTVGDAIYYWGFQVEQNSFASQLVAGTRSSTQAVYDLTGKVTVTASSLTYNSDGTFSYGGSDYLTLPSSTGSFGTTNFTICCWWKSSTTPSNYTAIMEQGFTGSPTNGAWAFKVSHSSDNLNFTYYNGGISDNLSGVGVCDGNWHYLVAVRAGTTLTLYKDTVSVLTITLPTNYSFGEGSSVFVGYNPRDGAYLKGTLPVLQTYNRELTVNEIQQNFNGLRKRYGV